MKKTAYPPSRPVLIWDGECGFCRKAIARLRHKGLGPVTDKPYQELNEQFSDLPPEDLAKTIHLVTPDGNAYTGAHAIFKALSMANRRSYFLKLYERSGFFAKVSEAFYRLIANNRPATSKLVAWFIGPDLLPKSYRVTNFLFLRLLAVVAIIAWLSMASQIDALVSGNAALFPAERFIDYLRAVADKEGWSAITAFLKVPTLGWVSASSTAINGYIGAGLVLAVLLLLNIWPKLCLAGMWLCYLTVTNMSGPFFSYQWDALLCETFIMALFWSPMRLRPSFTPQLSPSHTGLFLMRFLLFKLLFLSGMTKILGGDPAWINLTALNFHFETQPLPTPLSYLLHQAPTGLLKVLTAATLAIEIGAAFLVFAPRRLRLAGFFVINFFMLAVMASGNFGFFNFLAMVLTIPLLDDDFLKRLTPNIWLAEGYHRGQRQLVTYLRRGLGAALLLLSLVVLANRLGSFSQDHVFEGIIRTIYPFNSINGYGLFVHMTKERREVVLEGRQGDGPWQSYGFKYKPELLTKPPSYAGLHMPRLDWQMWFAALSTCEQNMWFQSLLHKLLLGEKATGSLFAINPFPDEPPTELRAPFYIYRFASPDAEAGVWWQREEIGRFCPTVRLQDGRLIRAED